MKTTKIIFLFILCFSLNAVAEEPAWKLVSMSPPRGTANWYNVSENGTIYLSAGNILYSTNNGDSWDWNGDDNNKYIIAYDDYIFTTKETETNYYSKIYRSSDKGKTWISCTGDWGRARTGIWKDKNYLYALVIDDNTIYHIYNSSNYGDNWHYKGNLKDPITRSNVYLSVYNNIIITSGTALQTTGTNIKVSLDTGKTWDNIVFPNSQYMHIIIKKPNEIYSISDIGIFLSTDTCKHWKPKYLDGYQVTAFDLSEDKKNMVASVANKGIIFSSDSGKTWVQSNEFISRTKNISSILFGTKELTFCNPWYLAPFRSTDFGKTWEEVSNGFSATAPLDFVINPYGEMFISHFGIFKSEDQGLNFKFLGVTDYYFTTLAYNSKGYIFAGQGMYTNEGNGIYRSKDGGKTWESFFKISTGINSIIIDSQDKIYAAISAGSVIRSTDDGETWEELDVNSGYLGINDEGHIFSFSSNIIYRSMDNGESWEEVGVGEYDPTAGEGYGRIIFNSKTKTAAYYGLVTIDNGRSWWKQEDYGYGFGNTNNMYFAVDSSYNWLVAYKGGILRSTENGKSWERMDTSGLKHSGFIRPAVSPDGHIYVFGATGGLYRSRDRFVSVEEKPEDLSFIKNFPNPATNKTQVIFNIKKSCELSLSVFDALGKLCETKNYGIIEYGETNILLDTENYPPGTYTCKIQCGGEVQNHSFVIVK